MSITRDAIDIMDAFAERTAIGSPGGRRYLWTDAFAVCNFIGLYRSQGERRHLDAAIQLIDDVHTILGRHRSDDDREGWISGLSEEEGCAHPTIGGLRIGKRRNERPEDEPFESVEEWDRDGQYFHYLTRWMHALHQAALATQRADYLRWALELFISAARAFRIDDPTGGPPRMAWKISIDQSRSLVPSMGAHDPLEGFVCGHQLRSAPGAPDSAGDKLRIDAEACIGTFAEMCAGRSWTTTDPLGMGGLLMDAARLATLAAVRTIDVEPVFSGVLRDCARSLDAFDAVNDLDHPAERRLAFRELGLAIGLRAMEHASHDGLDGERAHKAMAIVNDRIATASTIIDFWSDEDAQRTQSWLEHEDINAVMLASALEPEGVIDITWLQHD